MKKTKKGICEESRDCTALPERGGAGRMLPPWHKVLQEKSLPLGN